MSQMSQMSRRMSHLGGGRRAVTSSAKITRYYAPDGDRNVSRIDRSWCLLSTAVQCDRPVQPDAVWAQSSEDRPPDETERKSEGRTPSQWLTDDMRNNRQVGAGLMFKNIAAAAAVACVKKSLYVTLSLC